MERRRSRPRPARAGFTFVEVLVVVLIIATLMALLLPAVNAAIKKAREAQVSAEITQMATALASFRTTYGDYPPSRVLLSEFGYSSDLLANATVFASGPSGDSNGTDMTVGQLAQRSLLYLRRFFPRADFNTAVTTGQARGTFNDFNGDGVVQTTYYVINGSECLTFFLGGIPIPDLANPGMIKGLAGFSRSPQRPFVDSLPISATNNNLLAPNRTNPNFEFNAGRLIDGDNDGIPSYIDPLDSTIGNRREYAYFSAYGANQYDPNDVNGYGLDTTQTGATNLFEQEDDGSTFVERGFTVTFPTSSGAPYVAKSTAPNPYTSGPAAIASTSSTLATVAWQNPNSFQILCAGQDRLWGLGGQFVSNSTGGSSLPIATGEAGLINAGDATNNIRQRENDNLTNFSSGRLQ